jgi:hypothetical protein
MKTAYCPAFKGREAASQQITNITIDIPDSVMRHTAMVDKEKKRQWRVANDALTSLW